MHTSKKIMILAGEASGDHRGAEVAEMILKKMSSLKIFGIGGEKMRAAGVETFCDISELSVMGLVEVVHHLPRIIKIFNQAKKMLQSEKPDLLICVDYPGFNLRFAAEAKKLEIPVLFYISPQVWAWRQGRVKKIARLVDHMAVIFPFEKAFYESHDVQVSYVGHPLTQTIQLSKSREKVREELGIAPHQKLVALMPGSRYSELNTLLPIMIGASEYIAKHHYDTVFIVAAAPTISDEALEVLCKKSTAPIRIIRNDTYHIVHAADACITASGTATLETALLNTPMVIVYRLNAFTAMLAKWMIKIPYVSLCNIVAGEAVVKELLQEHLTVKNVGDEVLKILHDETYRNTMKTKLSGIREKLGNLDAADNVADIAIRML